jgi:hypothetical protein
MIDDDIHDVIHAWIGLVTDLDPDHIIPTLENEHRPAGSYVQIHVVPSKTRIGMQDTREYQTGEYHITGHREQLVSLQSFGPDAYDLMSRIEASADAPSILKLFRQSKIVIADCGPVRDFSRKIGHRTEGRAQMDLTVRYAQTIIDEVPIVLGVGLEIEVGTDTVSDTITPPD